MGVTGLYQYLKKKYNHKSYSYDDLAGKLLYVDLSIYVYKYTCIKLATRDIYRRLHFLQTKRELDPAIVPNVHEILKMATPDDIYEVFRDAISERVQEILEIQIMKFRNHDIAVQYIVDGPSHPLKEKTNKIRKEIRDRMRNEVETVLIDAVENMKLAEEVASTTIVAESAETIYIEPVINPMTTYVEKLCNTPQAYVGKWIFDIAEAKLKSLGVKLVYAPHDSEAFGSWLTRNPSFVCYNRDAEHIEKYHSMLDDDEICGYYREVFGILTEDGDSIAFGAKNLLRLGKDGTFNVYNIHDILVTLGISQRQLIDMCICMGCDYTDGVIGVGPVGALKQLIRTGTIANITSIPLYEEIVAYFTHA